MNAGAPKPGDKARGLPPRRGTPDEDDDFRGELHAASLPLNAFARRLTGDADKAADLLQETLLRAWASRHRFEPGTSLRAWARTIMRNLFLHQLRRRRFIGEYNEEEAGRRLVTGENQTHAVILNELAECLDRLPHQQREAIELVAIEGLPYQAAADRSGTSVGTIKSRLSRARRALAAMLEGGTVPAVALLPAD